MSYSDMRYKIVQGVRQGTLGDARTRRYMRHVEKQLAHNIICIYVYACMHICICVFVCYICICIYAYVCVCVCVCVCAHVNIYVT